MTTQSKNKAYARIKNIGGEDLLVKLMRLFLAEGIQTIKSIQKAFAEKNLGEVEKLAHAFGSSAATLGETKVGDLSRKIEKHALKNKPNAIPSLMKELNDEFSLARKNLKKKLNKK